MEQKPPLTVRQIVDANPKVAPLVALALTHRPIREWIRSK